MIEKFDPMRVNSYSIEELADLIESGIKTKESIYACGFSAMKRPDLEKELRRRAEIRDEEQKRQERLVIEDEESWANAKNKRTVKAFERYVKKYDKLPPDYRGKHVTEAKDAIDELKGQEESLRKELFDSMRREPWVYTASAMKRLLTGISDSDDMEKYRDYDDIFTRFFVSGQKITYDELIKERIIPKSIRKESIIAEDHYLRQTNILDLGDFPEEKRTDVYFWGVPRGGKSSVLAGILSNMNKRGVSIYVPHWNHERKDLVSPYYYGLIESTDRGKFPVSTGTDTVSFMKLDLMLRNKCNKLTFVEIAGEAFRMAHESGSQGDIAWGDLAAGTCLQSSNRKLLLFVMDYSLSKSLNRGITEAQQARVLTSALSILSTDGHNGSVKGCTLSKVDTVAVVVTKSDLMDTDDRGGRANEAYEYISNKFAAFMTALEKKCRQFGINRAIGYRPYVLTFSLGKLYVGNTYAYDPTDSEIIVNFISDVTAGKKTGILDSILGGDDD
ncbi:MAG: hypothetical protein LUC88_06650 [Prevotella sp.]|nr:hypothetical protein [Prevotella sp.]